MAGSGVTVNAISPGPTLSEGVAEMLEAERQKSGKPIEIVATEFVTSQRPTSIIQRVRASRESPILSFISPRPCRRRRRGRDCALTAASPRVA